MFIYQHIIRTIRFHLFSPSRTSAPTPSTTPNMADVIFIEVAGIVAPLKPNVALLHQTTGLIGFPFYEGDLFGEHLTQVGTFPNWWNQRQRSKMRSPTMRRRRRSILSTVKNKLARNTHCEKCFLWYLVSFYFDPEFRNWKWIQNTQTYLSINRATVHHTASWKVTFFLWTNKLCSERVIWITLCNKSVNYFESIFVTDSSKLRRNE